MKQVALPLSIMNHSATYKNATLGNTLCLKDKKLQQLRYLQLSRQRS